MEKQEGKTGKMAFLPLLLLAAFLVSLSGCMQETGSSEEQLQKGEFLPYWNATWLPICIIAILISMFLNGMLYSIGFAINSQNLKRYALSEMLQTAATALMVVVLIGTLLQAFSFIGNLGSITCGSNGDVITDPIDADKCRSEELLSVVGKTYNHAFESDWGPEIVYSMQITLLGIPVFSGAWMVESIYNEVETYHSIAYICVNLMLALSAKLFMLQYVQENMLAVFLPLGIILRTFHFTRGIGAFFMCIAIGFFFIFPAVSFILDSSFASSLNAPELPQVVGTGMCNIPMFGSFSFGSAALASYSSRSSAASQVSLSNDLARFVADIQTVLFYNNLVALAITLTFIRYASTILGGDVVPFMSMVGRLI